MRIVWYNFTFVSQVNRSFYVVLFQFVSPFLKWELILKIAPFFQNINLSVLLKYNEIWALTLIIATKVDDSPKFRWRNFSRIVECIWMSWNRKIAVLIGMDRVIVKLWWSRAEDNHLNCNHKLSQGQLILDRGSIMYVMTSKMASLLV